MTDDERDAFLRSERTCRVASVAADGTPHASPLWFVWDGEALWFNTLVRSQRWTNLRRNPRLSVVVDTGHKYSELRGCELIGEAEAIGDIPRTPTPDARLAAVESAFGAKYVGGKYVPDGRHAWLRVLPKKIVSWDFRKLG